jgi:hypothetical protein
MAPASRLFTTSPRIWDALLSCQSEPELDQYAIASPRSRATPNVGPDSMPNGGLNHVRRSPVISLIAWRPRVSSALARESAPP